MYKELPKNVSIYFEDSDILGKAQATYPSPDKIAKHLANLAELKGKNTKDDKASKDKGKSKKE